MKQHHIGESTSNHEAAYLKVEFVIFREMLMLSGLNRQVGGSV